MLVYLKNILAGLGVLVTLLLLFTICPGDNCRPESLLDTPWAFLGLMFYSAVFLLPLKYLPYFAAVGMIVHIHLVSLMALMDNWCTGCILAAFITATIFLASIKFCRRPVLLCSLISIGLGIIFISVPSSDIATSGAVVKQTVIPIPHKTISRPLNNDNKTPDLITAYSANGKEIQLSLSEKPVLFFSYWCDHCTEVLETVAKLPDKQHPYLVNVFVFDDNYKDLVGNKLRTAGLKNVVYYSDFEPESVPMLLYREDGQHKHLLGENEIKNYFYKN